MTTEVSRRALLRGLALAAAGASVGSAVAACSSPSAPASSDAPGASSVSSVPSSTSPSAASAVHEEGPEDGRHVLLLHSWWGRGPAAFEWVHLLAGAGFRVVVPDLFGGRTASTVEEATALVASVGQQAAYDVAARAATDVAARGTPWAALGFSLGALFASRLSGLGGAGPDDVHLLYGGGAPAGPVSRTKHAYLHVVPKDPWFTSTELASTDDALTGAGVAVSSYVYPDAKHWFAERGTPGFDATAFAKARTRVVTDLDRLGG